MKMQAKIIAVGSVVALAGVACGQAYLAESNAAINMNNTMTAQGYGGPPPAPGMVPGPTSPGAGYVPGAMGGNTAPGMVTDPAMMGDPALMGGAGAYGQPGAAAFTPAATPIPTENVMTGRRVYDAVSGGMLEDAIQIAVRQSDVDVYPDDGISDNGIAGDGIRGNVDTVSGQYIGQFSNTVKNHLIHAVRNAENIDPMIYYGYHVAKLDPEKEGMKRYGLPLPGQHEEALAAKPVPDLPNVLELEDDRDELVRQWNHDFLAEYRVTPEDPQSEYYPVFVPAPPLTPSNYPVPTGYVSPQSVAIATTNQINATAAAESAQAAQSAASAHSSGSSGGGGPMGGAGI
jgi:hypothetical protein